MTAAGVARGGHVCRDRAGPDRGQHLGRHPRLPRAPRGSPVGAEVEVTATASYVDGRLHRFTVGARHTGDRGAVGSGEITRVVDADRFLGRL